jgi:hypothetical protein
MAAHQRFSCPVADMAVISETFKNAMHYSVGFC